MKKVFLILMLLTASTTTICAQQIYNELRQKAKAIISNPNTNEMLRQYSQFKLDALDYMGMKMREQMPDSTVAFLDRQALALSDFLSFYLQTIRDNHDQPAAFQVKLIKLFMDASYSNPLFNDPDKELVLSYFADGNNLTRFSLDTDWPRAIAAASSELKKMK